MRSVSLNLMAVLSLGLFALTGTGDVGAAPSGETIDSEEAHWISTDSSDIAKASGVCLVEAHNPHRSGHVRGQNNALGEVTCTYVPAGPLQLQAKVQRKSGSTWVDQTTSLSVLTNTASHKRHSRSWGCVNGTYRTLARAYAGGPNGQPPVWSLWAVGHTVSITC